MKYLAIAIKLFFRISLIKTLWINFKCLPFKKAIKIPIVLGKGTILRNTSGKIEFKCPVRPGLVTIGVQYIFNDTKTNKSIITNRGVIEIGGKVMLQTGVKLLVEPNALLKFGGDNHLGVNSSIIVQREIIIGKTVHMAWNVQIMDTNFHYVKNILTGSVLPKTKEVFIDNNIWIGNNVFIHKGAYIPFGSIVASNSFINKSYKEKGENLLLAGSPSRIIKEGITRVFDMEEERKYDKRFK